MTDETDPKQTTASQETVNKAWNDVGVYMETVQETWNRLANRNFDFWKEVAGSLKAGPVTANTLSTNVARAMSTALETSQDLWLTMVEPPRREVYAQALPTAFLYFERTTVESGKSVHDASPDPIHIPVHHQRTNLEAQAEITISGNPSDSEESARDALDALKERLTARRDGNARSYLLEALKPADAKPLIPGTYVGLIYLLDPPLPLANLRVVVQD